MRLKEFDIYQFVVQNTSDNVRKAKILGAVDNYEKANFGSELGIDIIPTQHNVSYFELLHQSIEKVLLTKHILFNSKGKYPEFFTLKSKELIKEIPIKGEIDENNCLHVYLEKNVTIDRYFQLSINIEPKSKTTITIVPNFSNRYKNK